MNKFLVISLKARGGNILNKVTYKMKIKDHPIERDKTTTSSLKYQPFTKLWIKERRECFLIYHLVFNTRPIVSLSQQSGS